MRSAPTIGDLVPAVDGVTVEVGGRALAEFEPPQSELIGLGFAIIVLILAFGSVLAMGLPIGVALFGVGVGASVVALFSNLVTIPDFATTLGAMIGIAVGIDYALFIVTRYRENLKKGQSFEEATVNAMDTAGRAVVFAGVTVVVSLLGMLLIGLEFISGLGIGAATTVAVTMIASITLLPALLSFAGHSDRGHPVAGDHRRRLCGGDVVRARVVDRPAADRGAVGRRDVACGVRCCPAASRVAGT